MVTVGLLLRIEAKPDKADEVEAMLTTAVNHIRHETATLVWFAFRLGPTTFGVFDASVDEANRQAHLDANLGALSGELAAQLFAGSPSVEKVDVIAAKIPGV
jgi:quinol monooxygenase YgiN